MDLLLIVRLLETLGFALREHENDDVRTLGRVLLTTAGELRKLSVVKK